jgi:IS5 family transposase
MRKMPKIGIVYWGYRGRKTIEGVNIISPGKIIKSVSRYIKQKTRKRFRARASIEPVIGHIKRGHRMWRNFLLDEDGDKLNTILAETGFNLRKMLRTLESGAKNVLIFIMNKFRLPDIHFRFAA